MLSSLTLGLGCRPQQRRPLAPAATTTALCGPQCFKATSSSKAASLPAPEAISNQQLTEASGAIESAASLLNEHAKEAGVVGEAGVKKEGLDGNLKLSPMGAATVFAGPSIAAGHSPSTAAVSGSCRLSPPAGTRAAARRSPRGTHFTSLAGQVEPADRTQAATSQGSSRKRIRGQASPLDGAMIAATNAAAAHAASPLAARQSYASPDSSAQPNLNQSQQGHPVQEDPPATRNHAQIHSTGTSIPDISPLSSEPIVISDSEEEKCDPAPNPNLDPHRPAQTRSLTSKQYLGLNHTPIPTPGNQVTPASGYQGFHAPAATPHELADSPFVIEITDSDDDCRPQTHGHVMTPIGSAKADASARGQHQPSRQSNAGSSRQLEGNACPSKLPHVPEAVPVNLGTQGRTGTSSKGTPTQTTAPEGSAPASSHPPLWASPSSSHTMSQAAKKEPVQDRIRQAACRSALLAVGRPGRSCSGSGPSSAAASISAGKSCSCIRVSSMMSTVYSHACRHTRQLMSYPLCIIR